MVSHLSSLSLLLFLACPGAALAQYTESRDPIRLPDTWDGKERISLQKDGLDKAKELGQLGYEYALERKAEEHIREQTQAMERQFETGQKVIVFRVQSTEVPASRIGDTITKQGDPVPIGSGDSYEEVLDDWAVQAYDPKPSVKNNHPAPDGFLERGGDPSHEHPGSHFLIVTRGKDGELNIERKNEYTNDPYKMSKERKRMREYVRNHKDALDILHKQSDDRFFDRMERELRKQEEERKREAERRQRDAREKAEKQNQERERQFEHPTGHDVRDVRPARERPHIEAPTPKEHPDDRPNEKDKPVRIIFG